MAPKKIDINKLCNYYDDLIKTNKLKPKNIIDCQPYKNLMI